MKRNHTKALMNGPKKRIKGNIGDWQGRHLAALKQGDYAGTLESSMVTLLRGWANYPDAHRRMYDSGIGEDYVLGPQWAAMGRALLGLLDGDLGRLDGGTLDGFIRDSLSAEGFENE